MKTTTRTYINLGLARYNVKGNMWKTLGSKEGEWHFISAHLNPNVPTADDGFIAHEVYLLMCSCRSFTVDIPADRGNPFVEPCKHIRDFDESEVEIAV